MKSYVILAPDGVQTTVSFMGRSQIFPGTPDVETTIEGNTLSEDASNIVYTLADGTVARFKKVQINYQHSLPVRGELKSVRYPSGEVLTVTGTAYGGSMTVESSLGYAMSGDNSGQEWDAVATNLAVVTCAPTCVSPSYANQKTLGRSLDRIEPAPPSTTITITNPAGGSKTYTIASYHGGDIIRVSSVTDGVGTWTYTYSEVYDQSFHPDDYILVTTVADLLGNKRVVKSRSSTQNILSDTVGIKPDDTGGQTTAFQYSYDSIYPGLGALNGITAPEHNGVRYEYDNQFNVKKKWTDPKSGPGPTSTLIEASYNTALCVSIKVCNRPDWIKDERDAQTDFTYASPHGGVATVTQPAPAAGGVRPQTRYTYGQFTAMYVRDGAMKPAAAPVWRLVQTSTCATMAGATMEGATQTAPAACVGTADEIVTSYVYEPSNVANNVRLLSVTTRAGDNSLSATTSYAYDDRGDVVTVDGPLAGTADTTRTYYDASRWTVGVVGPDPDAGGGLLNRATRTTYRADGKVESTETGTATNQSDIVMSSFSPLQKSLTTYNAQGRPAASALVVGGVNQTLTEYAYDAAGRPICSAMRMNPTSIQESTACIPTQTGADGPDRVTYTTFDAANRVIQITSGYGTSGAYAPRVEKTVTYTDNGLEATVADGKPTGTADGRGNLTTYEYDGFDRLSKIRYPNKTGPGSSSTDFYGATYDAAGNVIQQTRRGGSVVNYSYDALNRLDYRSGVDSWHLYDNLGRPTVTYSGASSERAIYNTYDALGRPSATYDWRDGAWRRSTYEMFDLAGRRILLQWADSFYVTYGRNPVGEVTAIYENGVNPLVGYTYDNLGHRTGAYRGNNAQTFYTYDAAGRLSTLALDLAGSTQDQAYGLTYNAAGQIKTRSMSNTDAGYVWTPGPVGTKAYTVNGLNQLTTAVGATILYDNRGNLTNDGARDFVYDLENRMTSAPGAPGVTLGYDPVGRLDTIVGSVTTRLVYSGPDLIEETDAANNTLSRYVPGPGTDEPIAWYEGATTSDRRFLLSDERGSVVALTNAYAVATTINAYDEYGVPAAYNQGCFQYTGQAWIPELGLYHYKARAYSPTLGRFLQTDPEGYDDGLNWYAYVGNDPVNGTDPTGTQQVAPVVVEGCGLLCRIEKRREEIARQQSELNYHLMQRDDWQGSLARFQNRMESWGAAFDDAMNGDCGKTLSNGMTLMCATMPTVSTGNGIGILRSAALGKGNFGLGSASAAESNALGRAWVGPGATLSSNGKALVSADGLRQYRFPSAKPNSPQAATGVQSNFEQRNVSSGRFQSNGHVDIRK